MHPRLRALVGVAIALAMGALVMVAVTVSRSRPAHAQSAAEAAIAIFEFALLFGVVPIATVYCLGLAVVPARVREAGRHHYFAGAWVLLVAAIVSFCFVWFCFVTWPLGLVLIAVSLTLLFFSLRRPAPS